MFVSCDEKYYYRVVLVGQSGFDCRLYRGRSHRIQGVSYAHTRRDLVPVYVPTTCPLLRAVPTTCPLLRVDLNVLFVIVLGYKTGVIQYD